MFQYAAGRALSLRHDTPLKLDIAGFDGYGLHQGFELHRVFPATEQLAPPEATAQGAASALRAVMRKLLRRRAAAPVRPRSFVLEPHFHYWDGIADAPANSYLSGYWQSEKYFHAVGRQIRDDFSFAPVNDQFNAALTQRIAATNAVSVHVRRGDYASDPKNTSVYELCSLDYYRAAIEHIASRVDHPHLFIFSDDISWVKEHMQVGLAHTWVDNNCGRESFNDMRLMSQCKHHIIANSSFSWWGAWLNPDPAKIVVAPKRWFANGTNSIDLLPFDWERM